MGTFFLQAGLVITRRGQTLEYVSRADNQIYFEEPSTGKRITLLESEFWGELGTNRITIVSAFSSPKALILPTEPEENQFQNLNLLDPKFLEDVELKLKYIKKLQAAGITKGQRSLIKHESKRIAKDIINSAGPPAASTIQRWWAKFEQNNFEVHVLVSKNARRDRGVQIDEASEKFVQEYIDEHYAIDTCPTAASAYRGYEGALKAKNQEQLTLGLPLFVQVAERTFYDRIDKKPKKEMMIMRLGREAARRHFKMIKGHLPSEHPLDVAEIDHTPMNLYVIDDLAFLPLGRPWLTVLKDRFSGVILGFYISFQATGLQSVFGTFKHSLSSHHLAYELWPDLVNPWPAFGRAHYYVSDRGADFLSPRYRAAVTSLGALYEYCERRTPWLKGSIERFFLTLEQTFFEAMPGRTFASLAKRGDYNPVKDAVVRFSTLIYLLHKWAADFHNIFPNKRKQARPLDLWIDGTSLVPPPYPANTDELNIILGAHHTGKLSQEGIRNSWLTYANDELSELMDLVDKGASINYAISMEDLGSAFVEHPRTKQYFKVPCTRPDYASGLSMLQHKYLRHEANVRLERDTAVDTLIETRSTIQARLKDEITAKETSTKVRLARIAGINSNSVLAGEKKTVLEPFQGQQVDRPAPPAAVETMPAEPIPPASANPPPLGPSFTNVPRFTWGT